MDDVMKMLDDAEYLIKSQGCRIQSFLTKGQTQYVVKHGLRNVSPSFDSIRALCSWTIRNTEELVRSVRNEDEDR